MGKAKQKDRHSENVHSSAFISCVIWWQQFKHIMMSYVKYFELFWEVPPESGNFTAATFKQPLNEK